MPLVLTYDPRAILERLAGRFGGKRSLTAADLGLAMDELLGTADVVIDGDFRSVDPALRARALGLRLGRRSGGAPSVQPGHPSAVDARTRRAGSGAPDLAAREMVEAEVVLTPDPLGAARAMRGGSLGDLVRRLENRASRHRAQTGDDQRRSPGAHRRAAGRSFRYPRPGAAAIPTAPGERQRVAGRAVSFRRGGAAPAPGERLSAQARLRAVVEVGGQATTLEGPWRDVQADHVLLGVQDFPVPLLVVRASRSLLAVAVVEIAGGAAVRLDPDRPAVALPLPNEAVPPQIVVRPLGLGREIRIDRGDARRIDLDPATLPGFGLHRARFIASATPPLVVEWRPDVDDQVSPAALRMGADRLSADISWVAASAFRPGLVWRTVRDGATAPWCPPVMPAEDLVIRIDEGTVMDDPKAPIVVDGITLYRKAGDASTWTYVPRAPTLEADATGKPLLRIVEAGGVGFLQCTARVALRDADRAALLQKLRRLRPEAQAIEAAALTVQRVALEWFVDGAWSTASEIPDRHAAVDGGARGDAPGRGTGRPEGSHRGRVRSRAADRRHLAGRHTGNGEPDPSSWQRARDDARRNDRCELHRRHGCVNRRAGAGSIAIERRHRGSSTPAARTGLNAGRRRFRRV